VIVIPAAGEGRRFREAGYTEPKHMIPLGGVPMIHRVVENVRHLDSGECLIVTKDVVGETRGAIDTILRVKHLIPRQEPLVVANCDQLLKFSEHVYCKGEGTIFTFRSGNPAHSYVTTGERDRILSIAEKQVISNRAVSGVYWFRKASFFLDACEWVMSRAGGAELYVSQALAEMPGGLYAMDAPTAILGTPEDFQRFEVALSVCTS
jgi:NDP-sugar pyrophosphorylase family protein